MRKKEIKQEMYVTIIMKLSKEEMDRGRRDRGIKIYMARFRYRQTKKYRIKIKLDRKEEAKRKFMAYLMTSGSVEDVEEIKK